MLQEGHAEQEAGRDVAIGYMEPHRRPETSALAEGLETVPRRRVTYRDTDLEEMDLPALLARAPALALIDELAHTNAPGVEHAKRYEDVRDVLAAGIDVFSTVNVQHLESLNDQVAELTGTRVRETIPDAVLGEADEVVLIDLTPEALIARLRAGKIYPGENIEAALEQLLHRREPAGAARGGAAPGRPGGRGEATRRRGAARNARGAGGGRGAEGGRRAAAGPDPPRGRAPSAWCAAPGARLSGSAPDLDLLWVKPPNQPIEGEVERQVTALRHLASVLGANFLIEESDDLVEGAAEVVRERGSTYIMVGESRAAARPGAAARAAAAAPDAGDAAGRRRADRRPPGRQGRTNER